MTLWVAPNQFVIAVEFMVEGAVCLSGQKGPFAMLQ